MSPAKSPLVGTGSAALALVSKADKAMTARTEIRRGMGVLVLIRLKWRRDRCLKGERFRGAPVG
jgi:hypothetical protein